MQCFANFASRHLLTLKTNFYWNCESGALNEYSRNLATPKKVYATPKKVYATPNKVYAAT